MKKIILIIFILLFFNGMAQTPSKKLIASCCSTEDGGRCTGSAYCTACKNCSGCKHCNSGGSCGVCDGGKSRNKSSSSSKSKNNTSGTTYSVKSKSTGSRNFYKGDRLFVANTTLNLRSGPGTKYEIIAKLKMNDELIFIESSSDWIKVKIKDSGVEGWTFGKYVY
ncbi:MAG: hypothetical protein CVU07_04570 [Bacteroidetes bacterium HGW-Bacteroidetes-23]|nr:MAG: hypothetical protein CVU07_04570 [Bacteroidetes bacterium HGW-Bacteroidetes-23]